MKAMMPFLMGTIQTPDETTSVFSPVHAVTLAIGQLGVTLLFTIVTAALLLKGQAVPSDLWTLNVAIVSFYLSQRVPVVKP